MERDERDTQTQNERERERFIERDKKGKVIQKKRRQRYRKTKRYWNTESHTGSKRKRQNVRKQERDKNAQIWDRDKN